MKVSGWLGACAALLLFTTPAAKAQDKPATETSTAEASVPVKLQVVLSEYDGTKKITSMPYTILAVLTNKSSPFSSLRMGVRIPINTTSSKTDDMTYVGTNIDGRVNRAADGRYSVELRIERSSLDVVSKDKDGKIQEKEWTAGELPLGNGPMLRQFRGDVGVLLRDGQESEATLATDPLTGRVLKVEVQLSVLK
jgi:hypothetical protein